MIQEVPHFISAEESKILISRSKSLFVPAGILGQQTNDYRVAEKATLSKVDPDLRKMLTELANLTKMPLENQEDPHIVRYFEGGEFRPHYDFFQFGADYYDSVMANGGQRVKSCLIYLNEDFEGGETAFTRQNLVIQPQTGKLIIWENVNANNMVNYKSLHAGLPVRKGEKYILVVWIRAKKWEGGN